MAANEAVRCPARGRPEYPHEFAHHQLGAGDTTTNRSFAVEIDASIAELGSRLDAWFQDNRTTFASQDRMAQGHALVSGFDLVKDLDRLKLDGMTALTGLLSSDVSIASNDCAAPLIRGFEFGAKLAHALHDELLDTDGENKVLRLMDSIVLALNAIPPGRSALTALFERPNAGVRASAGAYLIDLMPDRVVPLLKEIDEKSNGNSASFTAHWALLAWKIDKKSRFNYLGEKPSEG